MLKWADDNTCPLPPLWGPAAGPRWLYVLCLLSVGSVGPRAHSARTPRTAARAALGSRLAAAAALSWDSALQQVTSPQCYSHDAMYYICNDISMTLVIFARHGGNLQFAIRMTQEIKSAACLYCDGDRARRWEHRGKYSQEVWRKSLSHLTIRSCVATAIVFWIFTLGFEFAGSVALSSDGRFRVAIILINFQLIINCCFDEAFPFVIIYKINFDIWKLNFLSNFGTDRPLYCTLIGKGPKD